MWVNIIVWPLPVTLALLDVNHWLVGLALVATIVVAVLIEVRINY